MALVYENMYSVIKKLWYSEKPFNFIAGSFMVTAHEFIFSNKHRYQFTRHLCFWIVFSIDEILAGTAMKGMNDFFLFQSYRSPLLLLCSVLPVCTFSVYLFLYLLFPYLQKKRYGLFVTGCFAITVINCIAGLFFYLLIRSHTCKNCEAATLREIVNMTGNIGVNTATMLSFIALGIKFTKSRYLQQLNNRVLARQKISSDLKLLRARIQPIFLFESLRILYNKIDLDNAQAADMLLKFSELLSYMLYECNADFVLVQRELFVISEFIALEKTMNKIKLTCSNNTTENISKKYIPSFILLSLIQDCVINLYKNSNKEQGCLEIDIFNELGSLYCNIYIQSANACALEDTYNATVHTFISRLETFYKSNYILELSKEGDNLMITMSLVLSDSFSMIATKATSEIRYGYAHV